MQYYKFSARYDTTLNIFLHRICDMVPLLIYLNKTLVTCRWNVKGKEKSISVTYSRNSITSYRVVCYLLLIDDKLLLVATIPSRFIDRRSIILLLIMISLCIRLSLIIILTKLTVYWAPID